MVEIVKVQRPVVTTDPALPWLVYDKKRKHRQEIPSAAIPEHVKHAMDSRNGLGRYKAYFKGAWSSTVGCGLSDLCSDQDW